MAVTLASIRTLFPELSAEADARLQLFIDQAGRLVDAGAYASLADDAQSYLAAHLLTMANRKGGASGAVTAKSVGPVSLSYGQRVKIGAGGDDYDATAYGQQFINLRRAAAPSPAVI